MEDKSKDELMDALYGKETKEKILEILTEMQRISKELRVLREKWSIRTRI